MLTHEQQKQLDYNIVEEARLKVLLLKKQCDALDAAEQRAKELHAERTNAASLIDTRVGET